MRLDGVINADGASVANCANPSLLVQLIRQDRAVFDGLHEHFRCSRSTTLITIRRVVIARARVWQRVPPREALGWILRTERTLIDALLSVHFCLHFREGSLRRHGRLFASSGTLN